MTVIKAAAVQMSPVLYSREGTVDKVVRKITELGRQGVQFATFSEALVPYYPYFSYVQRPFEMVAEHLRLLEQAVPVPSAPTLAIGDACRQACMSASWPPPHAVNAAAQISAAQRACVGQDGRVKFIQRLRKRTPRRAAIRLPLSARAIGRVNAPWLSRIRISEAAGLQGGRA